MSLGLGVRIWFLHRFAVWIAVVDALWFDFQGFGDLIWFGNGDKDGVASRDVLSWGLLRVVVFVELRE